MTGPVGRRPAHARGAASRTRSTSARTPAKAPTKPSAKIPAKTAKAPAKATAKAPAKAGVAGGSRPAPARRAPQRATGRSGATGSRGGSQAALARALPDIAPERAEPRHLEVVRRQPRLRIDGPTRARLYVGAGALIAVMVAFALVFLHVDMAQRQFRLDRLSTQVSAAQSDYSRLRLQVAQLEAPQQIIATAEGKLGMRQPGSVTYLTPASPLPAGAAAGTTTGGTTAGGSAPGGTTAPAGDADWPQVKSQLAGSP